MKKIYIICSAIIFVGIAAGISFFIIRDMMSQIPKETTLVTMNEEEYAFSQRNDKLKVVEFMYTQCPDICPTTTQRMGLLKTDLERVGVFGEKVEFLSITIDPYRDTPEKLRHYMDTFDIENDGNWTLLTGDQAKIKEDLTEIRELAGNFQFQYRDPGDGFYVHSTFVYLLDENYQFIKKFPMGEEFDKSEVFEKIMEKI